MAWVASKSTHNDIESLTFLKETELSGLPYFQKLLFKKNLPSPLSQTHLNVKKKKLTNEKSATVITLPEKGSRNYMKVPYFLQAWQQAALPD